MTGLLRDLTARGLVSVPTPKRPAKPLGKNALYRVLTNPYYAGVIRYRGALHPGAHAPIVEPVLFDQVQSLLKASNAHATQQVQHVHHLKGLLHCGSCGSRMLLDFATNPSGMPYAYFVCSGSAAKKTGCTRRAVPVAVAERLVADSYTSITISDQTYRDRAQRVDAAFDKRIADRDREIADLTAHRAKLEAESEKLLAAHLAEAIDLPTLKRHQDRIRAGLADVNQRLAEHDERHADSRAFLHDSLRLITDAHNAYTGQATPTGNWRTKRSTHGSTSPTTNSYSHAWRNRSPPSSAKHTTAASEREKKPNGNTPHLPMSSVPVRHFGWRQGDSNP